MNYQQTQPKEKKERRKKKLPVYVSENDLVRIMRVSEHKRHKFAYMLGFYSGLRISEVVNLEPRFCTHAVIKGIDITRVQVLAGHSNIATTNIYVHLHPEIALEEFRRKF